MAGSKHTDVLIIGGGVIGMACAYYLLKEGRSVRIVEKEKVGSGASHANCGLITPSFSIPLTSPGVVWQTLKWMVRRDSPFYVKPSLDYSFFSWMIKFAGKCNREHMLRAARSRAEMLTASRKMLGELIGQEELNCEWETKGLIKVFKTEEGMESYREYNEVLAALGLQSKMLLGKELVKTDSSLKDDLAGGWFYQCDAQLKPDKLMSEWKRVILRMGAEIEENKEVYKICTNSEGILSVRAGEENYSADHYVLAAGSWSPLLAKQINLQVPVQPGKGYSMTMTHPSKCPAHALVLKERNIAVTPFQSGFRLGGTMELAGYDDRENEVRLNAIRRGAAEYLKEPEGKAVVERWHGWRPMTWDELPVIGRTKKYKNLFLATGHGMLGVSMSTGTGKLISELVTGKDTFLDIAPYNPERLV